MTESRPYNVLFLCTGNSARSLMAECLLRRHGAGRFRSYSAGSHPLGHVHPLALELLQQLHHHVDGLRSKSWDEFSGPGAPLLDFVFTVCDRAAGEACPHWPGQPITAHWGVEDPSAAPGPLEHQRQVFRSIYAQLDRRIRLLTVLPIASLDRLSLKARLEAIGKDSGPEPQNP
jgi:arsenate reductase